jgi:hypothetical protein
MIMQEGGELLAQAFVGERAVPAQHGTLEQLVLNLLGKIAPKLESRPSEGFDEPAVIIDLRHDDNSYLLASRDLP